MACTVFQNSIFTFVKEHNKANKGMMTCATYNRTVLILNAFSCESDGFFGYLSGKSQSYLFLKWFSGKETKFSTGVLR